MDQNSGRIGTYEEVSKEPGSKPVTISPQEYKALVGVSESLRPEELAVMRFRESRAKLNAPAGTSIINAFRLGFRAGRESKET